MVEKYLERTLEILIDGVKDNVYQGRTRNNKVVHIQDEKEYEKVLKDEKIKDDAGEKIVETIDLRSGNQLLDKKLAE